ncbi:Wdr65, partial [Symbiodinium sp. CCMP2456]
AHSITKLALSFDARYLFSGCEGGSVLCCEVAQYTVDSEGTQKRVTHTELDQKIVRFRYGEREKAAASKAQREDEKKARDLQQKLCEAVRAISATTASLDDLLMIPKAYLTDVLSEIRELEDRMQGLKHESDHILEQKENELQEKLISIQVERREEKKVSDEKYDNLFKQLQQTSERHTVEMQDANSNFDNKHKKLQDRFEGSISREYEKNSKLLDELQTLRDEFEEDKVKMQKAHEEQLVELRAAQENALREWRVEYDKVCNLLKSDGLKFEEALRQQESEYENQIVEILERERKALQDESEKATTALKDGVSMKQTIGMLQNQVKAKDAELIEAAQQQEELRKKLQASQEMVDKVRAQLKERERSLKVKDESLNKLREQMKHLESFRFVLFHKVRALEEERDPLEEQVNSLKTSVREMYNEFVREFRQKQKLDQALSDKVMRSSSLQQENVELRAQFIQLKKDGRRLIQEVETVLHPETTEDYTQMPKRLQAVLERHQKLLAIGQASRVRSMGTGFQFRNLCASFLVRSHQI